MPSSLQQYAMRPSQCVFCLTSSCSSLACYQAPAGHGGRGGGGGGHRAAPARGNGNRPAPAGNGGYGGNPAPARRAPARAAGGNHAPARRAPARAAGYGAARKVKRTLVHSSFLLFFAQTRIDQAGSRRTPHRAGSRKVALISFAFLVSFCSQSIRLHVVSLVAQPPPALPDTAQPGRSRHSFRSCCCLLTTESIRLVLARPALRLSGHSLHSYLLFFPHQNPFRLPPAVPLARLAPALNMRRPARSDCPLLL